MVESPKPFADKSLDLGAGASLTLTADALIYTQSKKATAKRPRQAACGIGSGPTQKVLIPLYNILYASIDCQESCCSVILDYADQSSRTRVTVARLAVPCSQRDDERVARPFVEHLLIRAYGPAKPKKRAYILVNPYAGPGGAERLWSREVKPVFEAARMGLTVVRTHYPGEAITLVQDLDLAEYDTIIPCSGDGLPHEVFNGLAKRPDARLALRNVSVAHIPCGSGNAMSCNLYGTHRPSLAALAIVKGVSTALDLVSITQGNKRTISFLSQALGIVAESDLATEHLRWMGGQRFTYGFLKRMFRKQVYPCDVAVKVAVEGKGEVKKHYRRERSSDALNKMAVDEESAGETRTPHESATDEPGEEGLPRLRYGTVLDELPHGWELMSYMAPDANFFSAALANDGFMDLVCVDGDISALASLKLLLNVESGHFFENPLVSYRKVEAYRVIPRDQQDGYISIDGERAPFGPFQAEIHRGLGTVLSRRGVFEAPGPLGWDSVRDGKRLMA